MSAFATEEVAKTTTLDGEIAKKKLEIAKRKAGLKRLNEKVLKDIEQLKHLEKRRNIQETQYAYDFYKKYLWKELRTDDEGYYFDEQQSGLMLRTIYCQFGN